MDVPSFHLPDNLIAQSPAHPRDEAKLLVYERSSGSITDTIFKNLPEFLPEATTLVVNNSKVEKCRLRFGNLELFIVDTHNPTTVTAMVRPGRKFKLGVSVQLSDALHANVESIDSEGLRTLTLSHPLDDARFDEYRLTPLPPYIAQDESLASEYQTVYAKDLGSKAAPTAGLHFTDSLLDKIKESHQVAEITLHVGLGTFASLTEENFKSGSLHEEKFEISVEAAKSLNQAQDITAVGTTTLRSLESYGRDHDTYKPYKGSTDIFITPGFEFKATNHLITNFHLPGTSLLLLVGAFIGSTDELMRIYEHAIKKEYRFYSFGDAMLLL